MIDCGTVRIGAGQPTFLIAEAGVNHNGSFERALELIDIAVEAGADAIKFQTFRADRLVLPTAKQARYQAENTGVVESQLEMLRRLELSFDEMAILKARCEERGILFLSTPFDEESVDWLERLGVPMYKLSSGDLTNVPLLRKVARTGKPLILSTGMANLGEIEAALQEVERDRVVLLHCTTDYPARLSGVNLRAMDTMAAAFGVPIGYSDHTEGVEISLAAVARGAVVVEKHFTYDRAAEGPDHKASLSPEELRHLVRSVRAIEQALGDGRKACTDEERENVHIVRKSVVTAVPISAGTVIEDTMLTTMRPGHGISALHFDLVVGKTATCDLPAHHLLEWGHLR